MAYKLQNIKLASNNSSSTTTEKLMTSYIDGLRKHCLSNHFQSHNTSLFPLSRL